MITQFKKLFYKVPKCELFLPCEDIVLSKNWKVCAIREDCGCLEIYNEADYLDRSITYYRNTTTSFHSILFAFDMIDVVETTISSLDEKIYKKLQNSIDPSFHRNSYYESFAITNNFYDFLILHSHADDITFICGDEDFLKFQFDGKSIDEFATSYYKCIADFSPHCKLFPWEKFGVDLNYYF